MQITYVLELLKPTKVKKTILNINILEVCRNKESICSALSSGETNLTTKNFKEELPSAVINQNIREVKALYKLFKKSNSKKDNLDFKKNQPLCYNNQNYRIEGRFISVPLMLNKKSKRYWFPVVTNDIYNSLSDQIKSGAKLGKASLFYKKGKYYFAVTVTIEIKKSLKENTMGIDLGLNQLAAISIMDTNNNEVNRKFYNGKEAAYIRRRYKSLRKELGRAKKLKKIKSINDKESRYITNLNHKISRDLVNLAVQEDVSTIVMENLKNIRKTAFSLKKADKSLNSWSFFQLQGFIEYKANLAGIEVMYISPKYTSQTCSSCGIIKKSNRLRNLYSCSCGGQVHADLNAARNICNLARQDQEEQKLA